MLRKLLAVIMALLLLTVLGGRAVWADETQLLLDLFPNGQFTPHTEGYELLFTKSNILIDSRYADDPSFTTSEANRWQRRSISLAMALFTAPAENVIWLRRAMELVQYNASGLLAQQSLLGFFYPGYNLIDDSKHSISPCFGEAERDDLQVIDQLFDEAERSGS